MNADARAQVLESLTRQVEQLRTSHGWQQWLRVAAQFRTYSLRNQLLIAAQRPDATWVAGYRTWQQLGRQVNRGEHGIAIFAPLLRRERSEADEPQTVLAGFRVVRVFDITQTHGPELPIPTMPTVTDTRSAAGVDNPVLLKRLTAAARVAGLSVETTPNSPDGAHGWYDRETNTITLVTRFSEANQIRTLLHELSHANDAAIADEPRPIRELVAESAAFIVGTGVFGLDMDDASTFYVTSWGAYAALLQDLAEHVHQVSERVEMIVRTAIEVTQ